MYAPYVRIKVGNLEFTTDVYTESDDPNTITIPAIISLTNVKNGSGQANAFTAVIGFVPEPIGGTVKGQTAISPLTDPNLIDIELSKAGIPQSGATLQYGYSFPYGLKTEEYEAMILDYSVEVNDGRLMYTITGISSAAYTKNTKYSFPERENVRPTDVVYNELKPRMEELGYTVEFADDVEGTDSPVAKIPAAENIGLFEYVRSVLSMAVYSGDDVSFNPEDLQFVSTYDFRMVDTKSNPKVIIYRTKFDTDSYSTPIVFNWMSKTDNIILNFKTDFKGSVLMSMEYDNDDFPRYGIDSSGTPTTNVQTNLTPTAGDATPDDDKSNMTYWAKAAQNTAYKATLLTMGIPEDIPITTRIKIVPLIYGIAHHSQGVYRIVRSTDTIDSGGFTTSFDLIKIPNIAEKKAEAEAKEKSKQKQWTGTLGLEEVFQEAGDLMGDLIDKVSKEVQNNV